jgi:hypothetical protein
LPHNFVKAEQASFAWAGTVLPSVTHPRIAKKYKRISEFDADRIDKTLGSARSEFCGAAAVGFVVTYVGT